MHHLLWLEITQTREESVLVASNSLSLTCSFTLHLIALPFFRAFSNNRFIFPKNFTSLLLLDIPGQGRKSFEKMFNFMAASATHARSFATPARRATRTYTAVKSASTGICAVERRSRPGVHISYAKPVRRKSADSRRTREQNRWWRLLRHMACVRVSACVNAYALRAYSQRSKMLDTNDFLQIKDARYKWFSGSETVSAWMCTNSGF